MEKQWTQHIPWHVVEQVVLTRCSKGHGRITHSYLLNNEERQKSIPRDPNYLLKHVLIDYKVNNLYDLFTNVAGDTILKCLKEINLKKTKNIVK